MHPSIHTSCILACIRTNIHKYTQSDAHIHQHMCIPRQTDRQTPTDRPTDARTAGRTHTHTHVPIRIRNIHIQALIHTHFYINAYLYIHPYIHHASIHPNKQTYMHTYT